MEEKLRSSQSYILLLDHSQTSQTITSILSLSKFWDVWKGTLQVVERNFNFQRYGAPFMGRVPSTI